MVNELNESDFETINEGEFQVGGRRGGNSWNTEGILKLAKHLGDTMPGKFAKIGIEKFYTTYRGDSSSEDIIKYASYYSRKELLRAFKVLGIDAEVKTMGTADFSTEGIMKVHIK